MISFNNPASTYNTSILNKLSPKHLAPKQRHPKVTRPSFCATRETQYGWWWMASFCRLWLLVCPWGAVHSLDDCFVQLLGLLVAFQNLTMWCISIVVWVWCGATYGVPRSTCESFVALPQVWLPTEIFVLHLEVNLRLPLPALRRQHHAFSVVGPSTWNSLPCPLSWRLCYLQTPSISIWTKLFLVAWVRLGTPIIQRLS